jgi:hypothetical protein
MPEFKHLGAFSYEVIWHRNGTPTHPFADLDGERMPMLAKCDLTNRMITWWGEQSEVDVPDYFIGLYYRHFENLREDAQQGNGQAYYHAEQVKMAIHIALSHLDGESGILAKRPPQVVVQSVETVKRWGIWAQGLRALQKPLMELPEAGE